MSVLDSVVATFLLTVSLLALAWLWLDSGGSRKGVQIHERWLADDPLFVADLEAAIRAAAARNRKET